MVAGPLEGFELTVEPAAVRLGGSLTVTLRNTTTENGYTGPKAKYDIQYQRDGGWQSIFHLGDGGWVSPFVGHRPGEGFTWDLTLSREGLTVTDRKWDQASYYLCEGLEPGTYRFVYWGLSTPGDERASEDGIAETFTVTEE